MAAYRAGDPECQRLLLRILVEHLDVRVLCLNITASHTFQCEQAGVVADISQSLREIDVDVRIVRFHPLGAEDLEIVHRRNPDLQLGVCHKSGIPGFQADFQRPVLCVPWQADDLEMIVERIRAGCDIGLRAFLRVIIFKHLLDFFQWKLFRKGDRAFNAGSVRRGGCDRDLVQRENRFLYGHKELEREFLEFTVADFLDLVQPQFPGV